ncbi:MAG: right-handed parallel beta-helix repeat-containing protein [Candidatus Thorarchaeota archaeon]
MKCFIKKIFVINILLIYIISGILTFNIFQNTKDRIVEREYEFSHIRRTSGSWILTGSPIYIDNNDPSKNWSITEATFDWCRGAGTWKNPYIIENVTFNGQNSITNCIEIRNSDVNFIIRNCTILNSGPGAYWMDASIKLYRVINGTLINNFCNSSLINGISIIQTNESFFLENRVNNMEFDGLRFQHCIDNVISKNNISNNNASGIYLEFCINNHLSENNLYNNTYGIKLEDSHYNMLSNNYIFNNLGDGISFSESNQNEIFWNVINNNIGSGMRIDGDLTTISENNMSFNDRAAITLANGVNNILSENHMIGCGIYIEESSSDLLSYYIDTTNLVNEKPFYYYKSQSGLSPSNFLNAGQVILFNCYFSLISNLNASHGTCGISIITCMNVTVLNNDITWNNEIGIEVRNSLNIKVSQNNVSYNKNIGLGVSYSDNILVSENYVSFNGGNGIDIVMSDNVIISGNEIENNLYGIYAYNSDDNLISGNNINENMYGLYSYLSDNNLVSGNTASYNNEDGISLIDSYNNIILNNIINFNDDNAIYLYDSNSNSISGNTVNNNYCGIYLYYSNENLISGNSLEGNIQCIIELHSTGNTFEDNTCEPQAAGPNITFIFFWTLTVLLVINGLAIFILLLRKFRKLSPS